MHTYLKNRKHPVIIFLVLLNHKEMCQNFTNYHVKTNGIFVIAVYARQVVSGISAMLVKHADTGDGRRTYIHTACPHKNPSRFFFPFFSIIRFNLQFDG